MSSSSFLPSKVPAPHRLAANLTVSHLSCPQLNLDVRDGHLPSDQLLLQATILIHFISSSSIFCLPRSSPPLPPAGHEEGWSVQAAACSASSSTPPCRWPTSPHALQLSPCSLIWQSPFNQASLPFSLFPSSKSSTPSPLPSSFWPPSSESS